jgi:hypothetical protein
MEYGQFLTVILGFKKFTDDISELYGLGFDFHEGKYKLIPPIEKIIDTVFEMNYTKEGVDWINWFMYEAEFGEKVWSGPTYRKDKNGDLVFIEDDGNPRWGAVDENNNPICYSFESLYQYIEQYKK